MSSAPLAILLLYAAKATGYVPPGTPPVVHEVPREFFLHRPECGGDANCTITALFVHAGNVIYLREGLTGIQRESTLVHELTHFLQVANGAYLARTCANLRSREGEAYRVADTYLNDWRRRHRMRPWVWAEEPIDCDAPWP